MAATLKRQPTRKRGLKPAPRRQPKVSQDLGVSRPADVTFDLFLVGHGYQLDVFEEGVHVMSACRDFSDTHKVSDLKKIFYEAVGSAIASARSKL